MAYNRPVTRKWTSRPAWARARGALGAFGADERGEALRHYVLAVVAAALVAIGALTILAERLYLAYLTTFGP